MARHEKSRLPEGDDGRTIVNMNVEGMPWYSRNQEKAPKPGPADFGLTPGQKRAYRWAAVKAALAVALIFGAVFAAFIAFCDFVWFR